MFAEANRVSDVNLNICQFVFSFTTDCFDKINIGVYFAKSCETYLHIYLLQPKCLEQLILFSR